MAVYVKVGLLKEPVSALTHFAGFVAAIVGLVFIVVFSASDPAKVTGMAIYGGALAALFLASATYHFFDLGPRGNLWLQRVDHGAIFLLIAGTYTPLVLVGVGGVWGASLTAIAWTLALAGIVLETTSLRHRARLSLAMYLGTGWFGAVALPLLWSRIPGSALALVVLGGVAYTAGVPFFLVEGRRWMHAAWHGFVLAGSALHVGAVVLVVV